MRPASRFVSRCLVAGMSIWASIVTEMPSAKGDSVVTNQSKALQVVIGDPRVQAFMHPEIDERFPLQVNLPEGVGVEAFAGIDLGVPSVFLKRGTAPDPARANLIVSMLELDNADGTVKFSLPIEGLVGAAQMRLENGSWVVKSMQLVEQ